MHVHAGVLVLPLLQGVKQLRLRLRKQGRSVVRLRSAPTLLANEDLELAAVGVGLGVVVALIAASVAFAPPPVDPLAF